MDSPVLRGDDIPILIVNDRDEPIGSASMDEARQLGMAHRIVRVMVKDTNGRILLQKRSNNMETYPNCWDNSAAGHVDQGESYEQAALRELKEEIGIKSFPLTEIAHYHTNCLYKALKLNRFNKLYEVEVPVGTVFKIQQEEVAEAKWFSVDEVRELIQKHQKNVTDGLTEAFERLYK